MCYMLGVRWLFALVLISLAAVGCNKPDYESCRQLCWRYAELHFWEKFDKETADLSPEDREKARAEREELWNEMKNRKLDPGQENCVTSCRNAAKKGDIACVMAAKTAAEARACKLDED